MFADLESSDIREDSDPRVTGLSPSSHRPQIWSLRPLRNPLEALTPPVK